MKRFGLLLLVVVCLPLTGFSYGIVSNSGNTPEDSVAIGFYEIDSAGLQVALASNDSLFLHVYGPSGALVFQDTVAQGDGAITVTTDAGYSSYVWKMAVANIDGSGDNGVYSYVLIVKDNSLGITTPFRGTFQVYSTEGLGVSLARLSAINDSLYAVLDSIQNESAILVAVRDTVNGVIDTLQSQDGWVATSANQTLIIDSLQAALDTLQNHESWSAGTAVVSDTNINGDTLALMGANIKARFAQVAIRATTTNDTALILKGNGSGLGLAANGGATGTAAGFRAGTSSGNGAFFVGGGSSDGIYVLAGATGNATRFVGGATSGDGIHITTTDGDGMEIIGAGAGNYDVVADIQGSIASVTAGVEIASGVATTIADTVAVTPVVAQDTLSTGDTVAIAPSAWTAADTSAYQGSAAGFDSTAAYGAMAQVISDSIATYSALLDSMGTRDSSLFGDGYYHKIANVSDSGAAVTVDAGEIMDSLFARTPDDTVSGSLLALLVWAADSSNWASPSDVWVGIDTAATIDTSNVGAWFKNNGGTGIDSNTTRGAVLSALDAYEAVSYDSTARVIRARGLILRGTATDDTPFVASAYQSGSGFGAVFQGASTLPGVKYVGGSGGGHGAWWVAGGGNANGMFSQGAGTGAGIYGYGGAYGAGGKFVGGSTQGAGMWIAATGTSDGLDIDAVTGNALSAYATGGIGAYIRGGGANSDGLQILPGSGSANGIRIEMQAAGTGSAITAVAPVGGSGHSITGNLEGLVDSVAKVTGAVVPDDTTASGETVAILSDSTHYQGAANSLTAAQVRDSVAAMMVDSEYVRLADSLSMQGAASSLTATKVKDTVLKAMNDSLFARVDSTQNWKIRTVKIATNTADNAVYIVDGKTPGVGLRIEGSTADVYGDITGTFNGSFTGASPANVTYISGDATAADNLEAMLDGTGGKTLSLGKLVISGANGTAGSFVVTNNDGPGVIFNGQGDTDMVAHIAGAIDTARNSTSSGADTASMKTMAANNPGLFYGPTNTGSGTYTHVVKVRDTSSATDSTLATVLVSAFNSSGSMVGQAKTNSAGLITFALDSGAYSFRLFAPGYTAPIKYDTVTTDGDTTNLDGYDNNTPSVAPLYGYLYDISGQPIYGAVIQAVRMGTAQATDTSGASTITYPNMPIYSAPTDTTGYFAMNLVRTSQYDDTTQGFYDVTAYYANTEIAKISKVHIPSTGSVDLGQVQARRKK